MFRNIFLLSTLLLSSVCSAAESQLKPTKNMQKQPTVRSIVAEVALGAAGGVLSGLSLIACGALAVVCKPVFKIVLASQPFQSKRSEIIAEYRTVHAQSTLTDDQITTLFISLATKSFRRDMLIFSALFGGLGAVFLWCINKNIQKLEQMCEPKTQPEQSSQVPA